MKEMKQYVSKNNMEKGKSEVYSADYPQRTQYVVYNLRTSPRFSFLSSRPSRGQILSNKMDSFKLYSLLSSRPSRGQIQLCITAHFGPLNFIFTPLAGTDTKRKSRVGIGTYFIFTPLAGTDTPLSFQLSIMMRFYLHAPRGDRYIGQPAASS